MGIDTVFVDEVIAAGANDTNDIYEISFEDPFAAYAVLAEKDSCRIVAVRQ